MKSFLRKYLRAKNSLQRSLAGTSPMAQGAYRERQKVAKKHPQLNRVWKWF